MCNVDHKLYTVAIQPTQLLFVFLLPAVRCPFPGLLVVGVCFRLLFSEDAVARVAFLTVPLPGAMTAVGRMLLASAFVRGNSAAAYSDG